MKLSKRALELIEEKGHFYVQKVRSWRGTHWLWYPKITVYSNDVAELSLLQRQYEGRIKCHWRELFSWELSDRDMVESLLQALLDNHILNELKTQQAHILLKLVGVEAHAVREKYALELRALQKTERSTRMNPNERGTQE